MHAREPKPDMECIKKQTKKLKYVMRSNTFLSENIKNIKLLFRKFKIKRSFYY